MSYPNFRIDRKSYKIKKDDGHVINTASDGTIKIKVLNSQMIYSFKFRHWLLTNAQADSLDDFYEGHKFSEFTFTDPETNKNYVCKFTAPPEPIEQRGRYKNVEVSFSGYRI